MLTVGSVADVFQKNVKLILIFLTSLLLPCRSSWLCWNSGLPLPRPRPRPRPPLLFAPPPKLGPPPALLLGPWKPKPWLKGDGPRFMAKGGGPLPSKKSNPPPPNGGGPPPPLLPRGLKPPPPRGPLGGPPPPPLNIQGSPREVPGQARERRAAVRQESIQEILL